MRRTFDSFHIEPSSRKAFDFMRQWEFGRDIGAMLSGNPGTGKTHLMIALAHKLIHQGHVVRFVNVNRLFDELRAMSTRDGSFGDYESRLNDLENTDVLFLDDIGAEKLTEWAESRLERVLSPRFDFQRPTFFSTNLAPEAMAQRFNTRVLSRMHGLMGAAFTLKGSDMRKGAARAKIMKLPEAQ